MIGKAAEVAMTVLWSSVIFCFSASVVDASDLKVLSVGALRSSTAILVPEFEKSSGHKVFIESGAAGAIAKRVENGEPADVVIVTTVLIERLVDEGKVVRGTQALIARAGMGISARKGSRKFDISSVDALKRTLLAAKSIGHTDPASGASSAIYAAKLLASLDIAPELKPKTKIFPSNDQLHEAVANGEVELGFGQQTEIASEPRLQLVGPLPAAVQNISDFSAAVVTTSTDLDAAKALITFLTAPGAITVMRARGLD